MRCPICGAPDYDPYTGCSDCSAFEENLTKERPARAIPIELPLSGEADRDGKGSLQNSVFAPGQSFGNRYTIVDRIGQGGMGVVYKAHDLELDRTVALKMIRQDQADKPESLIRFRRELRLAQQVSHPNVCRVHDLGDSEGVHYISMEYLEGHTLADLIEEMGRLSVRQTLDIADKVCAGCEAIHAQGIVHRDLKPSNIAIL